MTTKQELLDQIKVLEDKVNKLETPKPEEKAGVIYDEPEYNDTIFVLGQEGGAYADTYSPHYKGDFLQGNLFYDQASAELESKRRAIRHRLSEFCRNAWKGVGIALDWANPKQSKRNLVWSYTAKKLSSDVWYNTQVSDFSVPTDKYVDAAREQFTNAELKLALTGSE